MKVSNLGLNIMFEFVKFFFMSKNKKENFRKEQIRGTIKQLMKVRGLRSISIANYNKWNGQEENQWLHSLKLDIQDGYLYMYGFRKSENDSRSGERLENLSIDQYDEAYTQVMNILADEDKIPSNVKRNILVKIGR